jgi:predicted TIM-barrel enzyme
MSCVLVGSGINMYNLTHYSCQMSCVLVGSDINMYNLTQCVRLYILMSDPTKTQDI